jgi:protein-S-isoprenylcysteine O-methyltransferase Ste14
LLSEIKASFAFLLEQIEKQLAVMPVELPPDKDQPGIVIPPPLLFVLPLAAAFLGERFAPMSFVHGPLRWIIGSLFVLAGLALDIVGFATQRRAGTDPIPFHPTTRIVSHGLYRFSRNPMYLGFGLWTLGIALLLNSAWMLLAVPIGLVLTDRLVIAREEQYLERKFGEEYLRYKRGVRRWL